VRRGKPHALAVEPDKITAKTATTTAKTQQGTANGNSMIVNPLNRIKIKCN
jgi:hypothetical protein